MNKQSYRVRDTFNDRVVSQHRTVDAAAKAEDRFLRAVRRSNGPTSYIPTRIEERNEAGTWVLVDADVLWKARDSAQRR